VPRHPAQREHRLHSREQRRLRIDEGAILGVGGCRLDREKGPGQHHAGHRRGSTKSYAYTREHHVEVVQADFVPPREEIATEYGAGAVQNVMMHDGSWVKFRKVAEDYDPTDRDAAYAHIRAHQKKGEVVTGLLYLSGDSKDVHDQNETIDTPLFSLPHDQLCPGNDALQKLMAQFR